MDWKKLGESALLLTIGIIVCGVTIVLGTSVSSPIATTAPNLTWARHHLTPVPYLPGLVGAIILAGIVTIIVMYYWED